VTSAGFERGSTYVKASLFYCYLAAVSLNLSAIEANFVGYSTFS